MNDFVFDDDRERRLGFAEAIFCGNKSVEQIGHIIASVGEGPLLFTRLAHAKLARLIERGAPRLDYDALSGTAILGTPQPPVDKPGVVIVAAGTSDMAVAAEARRTLEFHGIAAPLIADVGVAGLWRLQARIEEIRSFPVIIAVAGMDAALPTVIGGLTGALVIGVPTSVGYGAARGGETALMSMLTSCAPGLVVTNIDNGYGAAMAAIRAVRALDAATQD